jgi:hypothetical protein
MLFYLGTHQIEWLYKSTVPLFVSARRLRKTWRHSYANTNWALDSGGFSELSMYGKWKTTARQYAAEVWRWEENIGKLDWASQQDWMCEPIMLDKTGLTVKDHQRLTIENYLELLNLVSHIHWLPVLQGWEYDDYFNHFEQYKAAGIELLNEPIVGLGSMCRRQSTKEAQVLIEDLYKLGLKLHLFGFKINGLKQVGQYAESADSMAWSLSARRENPLPGCTHKNCANCIKYAMKWRKKVLQVID